MKIEPLIRIQQRDLKSRKETPSHASTQVHKDKTKVIPRKKKYKLA
jgi:hypothetical protein